MTHEDFVTYEQAMKLKDLGFNWKCISVYDEEKDFKIFKHFRNFNEEKEYYISAPTLSQVQKWLREVKGIHVYSHITSQPELKGKHYWEITSKNGEVLDSIPYSKLVDTYEEALSGGIDKALEIIKNK